MATFPKRATAPADVTETLRSVALASWSGLRDGKEAARQHRAIADQLENGAEGAVYCCRRAGPDSRTGARQDRKAPPRVADGAQR
jgi:hypothetical protein